MGWVCSISLGSNDPAFGTGLAVLLFVCTYRRLLPDALMGRPLRFLNQALLFVTTVVVLVGFSYARCHYIYRERPARELRCPLDGVLAGGKKIWTNPQTFGYLQDLKQTIDNLHGREYAVIPDCAIHWVKAGQKNPLSIDWPQAPELSNPALFRRVINDLESRRGRLAIVTAKHEGAHLCNELKPITDDFWYYPIVAYVRHHFHKTSESQYFDVYE
jgi:hypothetical protein